VFGAAPTRLAFQVGVVAFVVGLIVAIRLQPIVLYDDFGITARYAARIAGGDGWTYNPGDRTNGASAPLYTVLLAALRFVGIDLVTAARGVGALSYAACIGLVTYLGARIVGVIGGAFAAGFLVAWLDFSAQGLSGMESSFAAALGLAVIVALVHDREVTAGVLLGLALLTKLDAGMLAVAVAIAFVVAKRRIPWRLAGVSAAVVLPWIVFSAIYFGSPLPNSMTSKLSGSVDNGSTQFDRTWIVDSLRDQKVTLILLLALASLGCALRLRRSHPTLACGLLVALLWPMLHLAVFSFVDFGDRFPWYLTVLYPPLALAAGCTLGWAVNEAHARSRPATIGALVAVTVVAALAVGVDRRGGTPVSQLQRIKAGSTTSPYLEFEKVRREAGQRVAEMAEPGEVIATCYGWVAFEALDNPIHETCPLNTRKTVEPIQWVVMSTYPGKEPPASMGYQVVPVLALFPPPPNPGRMDIGEVRPEG
jgi:hypothetical protein